MLDGLGGKFFSTLITSGATSDYRDFTATRDSVAFFPGTGRIDWVEKRNQQLTLLRRGGYQYDGAGNIVFSTFQQYLAGPARVLEDRASFYDGLNRLRATDPRQISIGGSFPFDPSPLVATLEEYRYDALGRRVLTRTRRSCDASDEYGLCGVSTIRRTLWAGDELLMEIQQPSDSLATVAELENDTAFASWRRFFGWGVSNFDVNRFNGRVAYTLGPGLDQPLSFTRWGFQEDSAVGGGPPAGPTAFFRQWTEPLSLVPQWNRRGEADNGAFADGATKNCLPTPTPVRCVEVGWPFGWTAYSQKVFQLGAWHGSLLEQQRDGSGLLFRRHRYVDPGTAVFTQEDPIGLAGGLNLYGVASGDPVNLGDPFGLLSCPPNCLEVFEALGRMAPGMKQMLGLFAAGSAAGGAAVAAAGGGGAAATVSLGLRGLSPVGAASAVAAAVRAAGGTAGQQVFEAARRVGELGLRQGAAVRAVEQSLSKLGFEMGPTVSIGGSRYVLAARAGARGIDAIGVDPAGRTSRALVRLGERGWELIENLGAIRQR